MAEKKRVALITADSVFADNVKSTMARLDLPLDLVHDAVLAGEILSANSHAVVLFDEAFAAKEPSLLKQAASQSNRIICTDGDEKATIRLLADLPKINHVFGKNKPYYHVELMAAVSKIATGAIGSIEKYLAPDSKIYRQVVTDYDRKSDYLDQVQDFATGLNCFPDFPDMVSTVTWELLMNAMFDAPHDFKTKKPKYAHFSRQEKLKMQKGEEVSLAFGADDHSFVVAVTDNFGMLTRKTVVESLVRCSREGKDQVRSGVGGAGVGMYMMFNSISQINFNIIPGKKTEVIFVVFLSKRMKDFVLRARSVNFFVEGAQHA